MSDTDTMAKLPSAARLAADMAAHSVVEADTIHRMQPHLGYVQLQRVPPDSPLLRMEVYDGGSNMASFTLWPEDRIELARKLLLDLPGKEDSVWAAAIGELLKAEMEKVIQERIEVFVASIRDEVAAKG